MTPTGRARADAGGVSELCHDLRQPVAALVAVGRRGDHRPTCRSRPGSGSDQISHEAHRLCGMVQAVLDSGTDLGAGGPRRRSPGRRCRAPWVTYRGRARPCRSTGRLACWASGAARPGAEQPHRERRARRAARPGASTSRCARPATRCGSASTTTGRACSRRPAGLLGLLIVDRVVREHGGEVIVEDSALRRDQGRDAVPGQRTGTPAGGLRLVLCDDHRLFVESLAVVLQERGWDVVAVVDRPGRGGGGGRRAPARTSVCWTRCSTATPVAAVGGGQPDAGDLAGHPGRRAERAPTSRRWSAPR